jgi:hypothetical protein
MKTTSKIKTFVSSCLIIAGIGFAGMAQAAWLFAQGNVAQVERPANCTFTYFGWGLDLTQNSSKTNWIHLPVPTQFGGTLGAQLIRLKFFTGSADAWVSDIHVYNGDVKVKEFPGLDYSNGWHDIKLDLGSKLSFNRGLSFSIKINAGVEPVSHRFVFSSAGAKFVE